MSYVEIMEGVMEQTLTIIIYIRGSIQIYAWEVKHGSHIHTRRLMGKYRENRIDLHMVFTDLEKLMIGYT